MATLKQLSRIFSEDDSLNRVQDQIASALNPILRGVKGDLSGPLESPTVAKLQGYPVSNVAPAYGESLVYNGSQWTPTPSVYGSFVSRVTQTIPLFSAGTPLAAAAEVVSLSKGVSVESNGTNLTRFTVATAGVYELSFSAQLTLSGGTKTEIYNWIRINGADVDDTSSLIELGNNNGANIPYNSFILSLEANQYVEFMFAANTVAATPSLTAVPAVVGPPARPLDPSIIVNVKRVGF